MTRRERSPLDPLAMIDNSYRPAWNLPILTTNALAPSLPLNLS